MKIRVVSFILLLTLFTTGVFGVLLMSASGENAMSCALPSMGGMDCAIFSNALAMMEHHVGVYQGLLTAILSIVAGVLLYVASHTIRKARLSIAPVRRSLLYRHDSHTAHDRLIHRWLACLRMQDAFAYARVHVTSS